VLTRSEAKGSYNISRTPLGLRLRQELSISRFYFLFIRGKKLSFSNTLLLLRLSLNEITQHQELLRFLLTHSLP